MKDLEVNRHAVPDWHRCQSVVLVYPHKLKDREHLIPFYDKLLSFIPVDVGITLIVRDLKISDEILLRCRDNGITNQIDFIEIPDISDIWIRDYAPLTILEEGIMTGLQFEYAPAYVDKKHQKYLQQDHNAGELIWKHINGFGVNSMYFKWDMGNLTHNGIGTAIITNRLIADNQSVNIEHELKPMLHVFAGFKNIIFIPVEDGDATGHVDGMVRFIDEKTIVVGAYDKGIKGHDFMTRLVADLQNQLGKDYTIIRLLNAEPEDYQVEGVGSAKGNHMNFLRLGDKILMPYYSDEISGQAVKDFKDELKRLALDIEVIAVDIPELYELGALGGVLNCVSWGVT